MKILVLDANPNTKEFSQSKWALDKVIPQLEGVHTVDVWPLYKMDIPMIDEDVVASWGKLQAGESLTASEQHKVDVRSQILKDFKSYDHFIIVSPFWNFGVPAQLKALIDVIAINGETFAYTEKGPKGLLEGSFTHIQASGGIYTGDYAHAEFGNRYIMHMFAFLGLTPIAPLLIEGTNMTVFDREAFMPTVKAWTSETIKKMEV